MNEQRIEQRLRLLIAIHALGSYPCYAFLLCWEIVRLGSFEHVDVGVAVWFALAPITIPFMFVMYVITPPSRFLPGYVLAGSYGCAIVASYLLLRWRARQVQRKRRGRCAGCGYDLRATPARCPECGAVPEAQPGSAA